ncbi:molybdopterin-dependent oxidoreductase [Embleya sp. NPDC020886]|uniref:molybdopterin-dependent oxidoreductase n=1 Tax=Embleya sp. NPDC020886 TaxID=3363980 RepID=UPI0037BA049D
MPRHRSVRIAVAGSVLAVLVAGCGDSKDDSAPAGKSATAPPPAATAPAAPLAPAKPGEVVIRGKVARPGTLTLADLRKLPQVSATVEYGSAKGAQKHTYEGVPLYDVLNATGPTVDPAVKNGNLRLFVAATGGGNYRAAFAWAELDPGFARSQILLAVGEDGVPYEDAAGPHLVVPQDTRGGRYVSELNGLYVGSVDEPVDSGR